MVQDLPPRQELIAGPQNSVGASLGRSHPPGSAGNLQPKPAHSKAHSFSHTDLSH